MNTVNQHYSLPFGNEPKHFLTQNRLLGAPLRWVKFFWLFCTAILISHSSLSQDSTDAPIKERFSIKGHVDAYYQFAPNSLYQNQRPFFLFSHKNTNSFSLNMALIQLSYEHKRTRANIGLMSGDYARANLAGEAPIMRSIYEANVGYGFTEKLWLDAGIFSSNLGFESAISSENIVLSRCLASESSPYYLSGAKLSYLPNDRWLFLVVASNGWQNMTDWSANTNRAFGTQVAFSPSKKTSFNYSTFVGDEQTLPASAWRVFHNLYMTHENKKWAFILGTDIGMEEKLVGNGWNNWVISTAIAQRKWTDQWATAVRFEYMQDMAGITNGTPLELTGTSLNVDYTPNSNIKLRLEGRYFGSSTGAFRKEAFGNPLPPGTPTLLPVADRVYTTPVDDSFSLLASLAFTVG